MVLLYNKDMKIKRIDWIYFILLFIISTILVFDIFYFSQRPATFDGVVHVTQIAQFTTAIKDGDFPVAWLDGFANYGLPLGIFAQQLPTYIGALFNSIVDNPLLAFNLVFFVGIFLSNIFYYYFLKIYFQPLYAFLGAFLFNFASYRIIDIYIRGVTPEIFSMIFLPLILISIYLLVQKRVVNAFFLLVVSLSCLILTHPIMFVTYAFVYIPYFIFNVISVSLKHKISIFNKGNVIQISLFLLAFICAFGITCFYILPLNREINYLYFGSGNHLSQNTFLSLMNYFDPQWYYFYREDIFTRGHIIKSGVLEVSAVIVGVLFIFYKLAKKKFTSKLSIVDFAVITSIIILFFTSAYATFFYQQINILGNVQHQWRMISAFIFLPPIIIASIVQKINKRYVVIGIVFLVCIISFPQLYGKNYAIYPKDSYYFTPLNLHSINMNTIWSEQSENYPIKRNKIEIIKGEGKIEEANIKNSLREYVIVAKTELNVVDYTFYFPGWKVFVDKKEIPIEFQDPGYRGVITFHVPPGNHDVKVQFTDTLVRKIAKVISLIFCVTFILLFILRKRLTLTA